ncbi:MAG: aminopeptidase [Deltaproteobacteria bacterium]|nr:aminopeptidase [Deltaproteobacteria bacterium]
MSQSESPHRQGNAKDILNKLGLHSKHAADLLTADDLRHAPTLAEEYRTYVSFAKTERKSASYFLEKAVEHGFADLSDARAVDEKTLVIPYRNKVTACVRLGSGSIDEGMNVIASHQDSPRLDLKGRPLYQDQELALLKTHYYGGVRKYQWVTRPLAMHGVVVLENGESVEITIGEDESDPVLTILDLLPHLAAKQNAKKLGDAITAEKLNIVVGGYPYGKDEGANRIKATVLGILEHRFGMVEEDFISAELEIVPAGPARYVGLDGAFIGAYGHDARACAFTGMRALFDAEPGERTQVMLCVDKEEIGSFGNTSAQGRILHHIVDRILVALGETPGEHRINTILHRSKCISADVAAAIDPDWAEVHDRRNGALTGHGIVFKKFTGARGKSGASDASAELVGEVRRLYKDAGVPFQSAEMGKVDEGGGGTIAKFLAATGMEVIDSGPAVLAMHSPFELIHVLDLYSAYKAYKAFLERATRADD